MGWQEAWTKVKNGVGLLAEVVTNTVYYLCQQPAAAARASYAALTHDKTKRLAKHLLHVGVDDLVPIVLTSYLNDEIQRQGQAYAASSAEDDSYNPSQLYLQSALLFLVNAVALGYITRKKMEFFVRMMAVNLEAADVAYEQNPSMTLCQEEECSSLRKFKASNKDVISYFSTKIFIRLVGLVPTVGESVSYVLDLYHEGQYVATMMIPLCGRHQEQYLREYPEFALAQGLMLQATTTYVPVALEGLARAVTLGMTSFVPWAVGSMTDHHMTNVVANFAAETIESIPGLASIYYKNLLGKFLLVGQVMIASHMVLPPPVKKSTRNLPPDPIVIFVGFVDISFEVVLAGLKKLVPILLKRPEPSIIPWGEVITCIEQTWSNPWVDKAKPYLLPPMLQSGENFIKDPLINRRWESIRTEVIAVLRGIEDARKTYLAQAAMKGPGLTALSVNFIWGIPKFLTRRLVEILKSDVSMAKVSDLRRAFEGLYTGEIPRLPLIISADEGDPEFHSPKPVSTGTSIVINELPDDAEAKPLPASSEASSSQEHLIATQLMMRPRRDTDKDQLKAWKKSSQTLFHKRPTRDEHGLSLHPKKNQSGPGEEDYRQMANG